MLNYNFSLTYTPSKERNSEEIQTDPSRFMDLGIVRFCVCIPLFVDSSGHMFVKVFHRVSNRCDVIVLVSNSRQICRVIVVCLVSDLNCGHCRVSVATHRRV